MTPDSQDSAPRLQDQTPVSADIERSERFSAIGQQLRVGRESQGLSRNEVARALHLPTHLLDDLEAGRMERLAPLYRRGYINNYATLLGLVPDELLASIGDDEPPRLTEVLPVKRPRFRFDRYMKLATYLVVTIAIVPPLVMVYLNTGATLFQAGPVGGSQPVERLTSPATLGSNTEPSGDSTNTDQRPVSASALPLKAIRSVEETTPERPAASAAPEEPVDVAPEHLELELIVRLNDDSWVEITAGDDSRLEYDLLRADQERVYRGHPPFEILLGRASAVDLVLNGQALTWEGHDRGDVAELRIDADGAVIR
jgi:cytoskeleton protein RodZ